LPSQVKGFHRQGENVVGGLNFVLNGRPRDLYEHLGHVVVVPNRPPEFSTPTFDFLEPHNPTGEVFRLISCKILDITILRHVR